MTAVPGLYSSLLDVLTPLPTLVSLEAKGTTAPTSTASLSTPFLNDTSCVSSTFSFLPVLKKKKNPSSLISSFVISVFFFFFYLIAHSFPSFPLLLHLPSGRKNYLCLSQPPPCQVLCWSEVSFEVPISNQWNSMHWASTKKPSENLLIILVVGTYRQRNLPQFSKNQLLNEFTHCLW